VTSLKKNQSDYELVMDQCLRVCATCSKGTFGEGPQMKAPEFLISGLSEGYRLEPVTL